VLCSEVTTVNKNHTGGQAAILTCKRWSCPICHPINRSRVIRNGKRGKPEKFMTLTAKPSLWTSPDECAVGMRDAFAKLIRIMRKQWPGRTIEYMRVFEKTKAGWPHLHVLMRAPWIDQKWLSATWEELTGAFIVDIRAVDNVEKAVFYVTKYIGKELAKFEGVQRWFRSRNWNEPEQDQDAKVRFGEYWKKYEGKAHLIWWKIMADAMAEGALFEERKWGFARWRYKIERE
jgi:hypothetical protein